jgi:hypothetical protein
VRYIVKQKKKKQGWQMTWLQRWTIEDWQLLTCWLPSPTNLTSIHDWLADSRYIICFNTVNDFLECLYTPSLNSQNKILPELAINISLTQGEKWWDNDWDSHMNCEMKFMVTSVKDKSTTYCASFIYGEPWMVEKSCHDA